MEAVAVLLGLAAIAIFFGLPIAALVVAARARREAREVRAQLERVEAGLRTVLRRGDAPPPVAPTPPSPATPPTIAAAPAVTPASTPLVSALDPGPPAATAAVATPGAAAAAPAPEPVVEAVLVTPLPPPPAPPAGPRPTLEQAIGLTWFTRVGAAAFVLGVLYFFKYAIDNDWIGPTGRVAIGAAVGLALLIAAEIQRAKAGPAYTNALVGIGLAALLISSYAAAALYHLVGVPAAFAANAVILLAGVALSHRYRGEAILVVVLVAGFLNPVFLSTGEDRPFALFAYLFLLTGAALAVAVPNRFRLVPWIAMAGVAAIFGGWYEKFFEIHDLRANAYEDLPPEQLVGAYHALSARVVPLVFTALFAAQWAAAGLWLRARGGERGVVQAFVVAALVLAHAGAALLLPDSARLLALALIVLAAASVALLRLLEATDLLFAPMLAAFIAFLFVSGDVPEAQRRALVALLAVWTLVYLGAFLRGAAARAGPVEITRATALRVAAGAVLFAVLAGVMLVPHSLALFALVLALVSSAVAWVAFRGGVAELVLGALGLSTLTLAAVSPLLIQNADAPSVDPVFLAAAAAWGLVYFSAAAYELLRAPKPGAPASWPAVLTASLAGLGFLSVAFLSTRSDVPTLRALLTAAVGAADLALGTALARRRPDAQDRAAVLAGQALGLFAAALAFAMSGATVTVLWAALAAVAAAIAARSGERVWLGAAVLLFAAALARALAVDVRETAAAVELYANSFGRLGAYSIPVLFNERTYALAGIGLALLLSARLTTRREAQEFRIAAAGGAALGYLLVLAVAVVEVRAALTTLPDPPPLPLDAAEWSAFQSIYDAAVAAQRGSLDMITTLVIGAFAALLVIAGFAARSSFHRYLGLALLAATFGKLVLWDIWQLERIYQIVVLTSVGALLLAAGFLYARFGPRLVALVRGETSAGAGGAGGGPAAAVLLALLAGATPTDARAQPVRPLRVGTYAQTRAIAGVDGPGDYRFEVDEAIYRASTASALLADLRVAGPEAAGGIGGTEVPYVVREIGAPRPASTLPSTMLDPSTGRDGSAYATWEIAEPRAGKHCRIALQLSETGFLRRTRVETGDDRAHLGTVAEGAFVYRIATAGGATRAEDVAVRYPLSSARFVRVTLLPASGSPEVVIYGGEVSCSAPESEPPVRLIPLKIEETRNDPDKHQTIVTLDAGGEGLPLEALRLHVATPEFDRRVTLEATTHKAVWPEVGAGLIYRVKPREGFTMESVRVPMQRVGKRWVRLVVEDADSAPLQIDAVEGEMQAREVVFRAASAGEHRLYLGDKRAAAPYYDLADVLARAERAEPPREATLTALEPNPRLGADEVPPDLPFTERHRRAIGIAMGVLLVALSFWAIRLLRATPPAA